MYNESWPPGEQIPKPKKSLEQSEITFASVGQFGPEQGVPFDDGIHSAVKGLYIVHFEGLIVHYVQFDCLNMTTTESQFGQTSMVNSPLGTS